MLGSICGDILGSTYEFGIENQDIFLLHENDDMTDDSVLTCAVADGSLNMELFLDWEKGNINISWPESFLTIPCVTRTRHTV